MRDRIDTKATEFLDPHKLKCSDCGGETLDDPDLPYPEKRDCQFCHGQMMGWAWYGWKDNEIRKRHWDNVRDRKKIDAELPVSQEGHPISAFTAAELGILPGGKKISSLPAQAPWMSAGGACMVKVYAVRRRGKRVEFGIGNEELPILGWVEKSAFYGEWPK